MTACKPLVLLLALAFALTASTTSRGESHHLTLPSGDDADGNVYDVPHQDLLNKTVYSGKGRGTFYYDVHDACGKQPETDGYPACASFTPGPNQKTLRQTGSNSAIAINANLVAGNRAKYCGKKIRVHHNGKEVHAPGGGDFFVWDGCAACQQDTIIDFSASGLRMLDRDACNKGVIQGVSWVVTDEQVHKFVY